MSWMDLVTETFVPVAYLAILLSTVLVTFCGRLSLAVRHSETLVRKSRYDYWLLNELTGGVMPTNGQIGKVDGKVIECGGTECRVSESRVDIPPPGWWGIGYVFDKLTQTVIVKSKRLWSTAEIEKIPFSNISGIRVITERHQDAGYGPYPQPGPPYYVHSLAISVSKPVSAYTIVEIRNARDGRLPDENPLSQIEFAIMSVLTDPSAEPEATRETRSSSGDISPDHPQPGRYKS